MIDSILKEVKEVKNVEILYGATVKSYNLPNHEKESVDICLQNGEKYTCDLLVSFSFYILFFSFIVS